MHIIKATSPTDAWLQSHKYLLENGNKKVMNESINMSVEIENNLIPMISLIHSSEKYSEMIELIMQVLLHSFHLNLIHLWMDLNINRMIHL